MARLKLAATRTRSAAANDELYCLSKFHPSRVLPVKRRSAWVRRRGPNVVPGPSLLLTEAWAVVVLTRLEKKGELCASVVTPLLSLLKPTRSNEDALCAAQEVKLKLVSR
ncbi:hypothetical protein TgHK011_004607 [Trichoderma gracile]|nr:hypothetical protein TgHK011_004607 [Trichoderma gracile]